MIRVFLLLLLCMQASCSVDLKQVDEPEDLIPRDTMVILLRDMSLLESHIQAKYTHVSGFQNVMLRSGKLILSAHGVTPAQYERSMDFYCANQEEMKGIYAQVLDSLNRMSSTFKMDVSTSLDQPSKSLFGKAKEFSESRR